jgi:hypothetical protein
MMIGAAGFFLFMMLFWRWPQQFYTEVNGRLVPIQPQGGQFGSPYGGQQGYGGQQAYGGQLAYGRNPSYE